MGITTGSAYLVGWGIDITKGAVYSAISAGDGNSIGNYATGFETDPDKVVRSYNAAKSPDEGKAIYEHTNDVGSAIGVGKGTVGDRSSQYGTQETQSSVRLDDIEEHGPTVSNTNNRIDGAIEGRNPTVTNSARVTNQDYDGRYQEVERTTTVTNQQYQPVSLNPKSILTKSVPTSALNGLKDNFYKPSISSKDGISKGGFYIGLLQDAYKGITNFTLKGQAEDLIKALNNEEAQARASITVIAGKDYVWNER